eukprot:CAMPEP_0177274096 /NCGR_PEP_ID=MMETSP0367-20130122/66988_1 /TAXON_ID=447022 ORGANISM="Scrippsiella hangoei-like, Strain SHHI-4" /NCGR_SAMPLE_ID=MMETSP0367 /ASSEMBLY_ACC=CAM_ASM_000362 /LENGTH=63 /DNA_ID=CAMNT_0018730415 /DNA_START=12 /DNA_END=203 /DNA_ORIENTATION=+
MTKLQNIETIEPTNEFMINLNSANNVKIVTTRSTLSILRMRKVLMKERLIPGPFNDNNPMNCS